MSNNQKNDRKEARRLIISGSVLISVSIILALFLGIVGCSGGSKYNPADPASSKVKKGDISQDNATNNSAGGVLQNGTGSREGESGPGFSDENDRNMIAELHKSGKSFGGSALNKHLAYGVYDAETQKPIEGAYVSVGKKGQNFGQTDSAGFGIISNFPIDPAPGGNVGASTTTAVSVTAGADGYDMQTHVNVPKSAVVFYLDPIDPDPPRTGFVSGTFDYGIDLFLCNAYSSITMNYIDGIIQPSEHGDTDDTYSIEVKADEPGLACFANRNPTDGKIQEFAYYPTEVEIGGTKVFDWVRGVENIWHPYEQVVIPIKGTITGRPVQSGEIESITATCYYIFNDYGSVPMTDAVTWVESSSGYTMTTTYITSFLSKLTSPVPIEPLPYEFEFDKAELWVDVVYSTGGGCNFKLGDSFVNMQRLNFTLSPAPRLVRPSDDGLDLGVTPILTWSVDARDRAYSSILSMDLGNLSGSHKRWTINAPAGITEFELPALPVEMVNFGLQEGQEVQVVVGVDLSSSAQTAGIGGATSGGISTTGISDAFDQRNYSKTYVFTP